jgi:pimeloyl-ACP methyl ester carboxylesterase/DNA-binding CsgD family transcriptional regulator
MPHPVRYARTDDRVNIAYSELGEGEPMLYLPALPWSNFSAMLRNPLSAKHSEELSTFVRLIPLDPRGCGLSDHGVADLSLDGFARDIDAVADATGQEQFTLYGSADASRIAIHYAALRPERVQRLILWLPSVSPARLQGHPLVRAISPLVERDWDVYTQTLAHAVVGGWDVLRGPYAAAFAELARASIRPEEYRPFVTAMRQHDVSDDLARVQAPTLVLTRDDVALYSMPIVSEVAAGIPRAKLVVSPGNWLMPCVADDITSEIATFVGREAPVSVKPPFALGPTNGHHSTSAAEGNGAALSQREREVIALIAQGKTNTEIARALVVAPATASRHVHNILNKLGMSRRAEVAAYAVIERLA